MATNEQEIPERLVGEVGNTGIQGGIPFGNLVVEEFLPALQGRQGARKYREMSENDPVLGAILLAVEMLVRRVTWKVVPVSEEDEAAIAKEWVEDVLFNQLETPLNSVVTEALSMLVFGYAPFELVFTLRNDGTLGLRKIAIRAQETIYAWRWTPTGEVTGMEQWRYDYGTVVIPMEKLLLFRTTSRRNSPEGRSILRNAYIPYERKQVIEQAEGRAALRSAGIVQLRIPGRFMLPDADQEEKAIYLAYQQAATNLAKDRQGSIILPSDHDDKGNPLFELSYVMADSRRSSEMNQIVQRLDQRMAVSALADFILLGHEKVGSFALSSSKVNLFARAIGAFRDEIADRLNDLIGRLWNLNAFDPALKPKLQPSDLEAPDLGELGSYIQSLSGAGMPLFPDADLEAELKRQANLPVNDVTG